MDEILLSTIQCANRTVAYSEAGDPKGAPVLVLYPSGGNRRMLTSMHGHGLAFQLRLICVNRPGKGETSPVDGGPTCHLAVACEDAISVLNALHVDQVSLLFMCAGAPFALSLAAKYPERMTGKLVGLAAWVLPADCEETKIMYKLGCSLPHWLLSQIVSNSIASTTNSLTSLHQSFLSSGLKSELTVVEKNYFEQKYPAEAAFVEFMAYVEQETGGVSEDVSVLFSTGADLGIDYRRIPGEIFLYHGDQDAMVPISSAQWLAQQVPSAVLKRVPQASHNGILLLLHSPAVEALQILSSSAIVMRKTVRPLSRTSV